ncbi:MAG: hypothetical protein SGPRY_011811, partial [Prymnesium sp.]
DVRETAEYGSMSASFLLLLTAGVLRRGSTLCEIRASLATRKPLTLLWEPLALQGGAMLSEIRSECPLSLRGPIFHLKPPEKREVVRWHNDPETRLLALKAVAPDLLASSPTYKGMAEGEVHLMIPGQRRVAVSIPAGTCIFTSPHNPGAAAVARELAHFHSGVYVSTAMLPQMGEALNLAPGPPDLTVRPFLPAFHEDCESNEDSVAVNTRGLQESSAGSDHDAGHLPRPTHFLIVLSKSTWLGAHGNHLSAAVQAARQVQLPIILAHGEQLPASVS